MADLDRLRLGQQTVETLVAQMVRDVVAGLDPADPSYPDVIGGTFLLDFFGAVSIAIDRLADRVNVEMPRTALPHLTYGEWLDAWAELLGLNDGAGGKGRKGEAHATGTIEFTVSSTAPAPVTIPQGTQTSTPAASDVDDEIVFATLGEITLEPGAVGTVDIAATAAGVAGNVPSNGVTFLQSGVAYIASLRNPDPTTNGADVEDDEALQRRIVVKLAGQGGPGNVADYTTWGLEEPGVGFVTVDRNYPTRGGVRMILTDPANNPVGNPIVDRLKERLDPVDGSPGQAPIGAAVTVITPDNLNVSVEATIFPEGGFTVAGDGGTRPLSAAINKSVRRYIDRIPPGGDVIYHKVLAAIVDVPGVADATLTTPSADVAVSTLQVPSVPVDGVTLH